jgi:hypothetical protein
MCSTSSVSPARLASVAGKFTENCSRSAECGARVPLPHNIKAAGITIPPSPAAAWMGGLAPRAPSKYAKHPRGRFLALDPNERNHSSVGGLSQLGGDNIDSAKHDGRRGHPRRPSLRSQSQPRRLGLPSAFYLRFFSQFTPEKIEQLAALLSRPKLSTTSKFSVPSVIAR